MARIPAVVRACIPGTSESSERRDRGNRKVEQTDLAGSILRAMPGFHSQQPMGGTLSIVLSNPPPATVAGHPTNTVVILRAPSIIRRLAHDQTQVPSTLHKQFTYKTYRLQPLDE